MEEELYVSARVSDIKPVVPSKILKCDFCGADVWVDERNVEFAKSIKIICTRCLAKRMSLLGGGFAS